MQVTREERNKIVIEYLPYVNRVANRIASHLPPSVEVDDLVNVGIIGLIQAIERYDPDRDIKFMTYATFRIKGAILSELRSRDYLGRVTRKKVRLMEKAYLVLERKLGRKAKDEEVAAEMDVDMDELYQIKFMSSIRFVDIEEIWCAPRIGREHLLGRLLGIDGSEMLIKLCLKEIEMKLADCIEKLPQKERLVISMYYHDEMTMKEIGEVLDVSESRISQIHGRVIMGLRKKMNKENFLSGHVVELKEPVVEEKPLVYADNDKSNLLLLAIKEVKIVLAADYLPERERKIFLMRYGKGMALKDIAKQLGFSQSYASHIYISGLNYLRLKIQNPSFASKFKKLKNALMNHIKKMPQKECSVILKRHTEGMTMKEIAKSLDIHPNYASGLHAKAIKRLRIALHKEGFLPKA